MTQRFRTDCEGFHRRDFLKIGAAGLFGLSLPDLLRLEAQAKLQSQSKAAQADSVIMIWLAGGPATIDMWDLKPGAPDTIRGEFQPIDTSLEGVQISEHLPKMAQVMDKVTIARSVYHSIPSHFPATVFMTTGNKPSASADFPSLGSLAAKLLPTPPDVPPYVTFSELRGGAAGGGGYLGTAYNPFTVEGAGGKGGMNVRGISLPSNLSLDDLDNRAKLLQGFDSSFRAADEASGLAAGLDAFHEKALDILHSDRTQRAFELDQESALVRERYGEDAFGRGVLAARRLVEAGVRFVTVSLGGWDTHQSNFDRLKDRNLPPLDQTLSALIEDLDQRGLLDRTIVYCAGEFGRTPKVNRRGGRDHWARSLSVLLAGGGFRRGHVHGTTDEHGMAPDLDPCLPDDVAATIFQQLGIDPHSELMSNNNRPMTLFRNGSVVPGLLA